MDEALEHIIRKLPPRPQRSRLDPYAELIAEMRDRGWTYRAIAKVLAENCGVRVSYRNVHHFVKSAASRAGGMARACATPKELPVHSGPAAALRDVSPRIAALQQSATKPESLETGFEFDPAVPLRLGKRGKP